MWQMPSSVRLSVQHKNAINISTFSFPSCTYSHTHTLLFKGYSLTYFHVAYHLSNALLLTWINSDSQLFMKTQRVIPYCCSACYLCMYVRICDDIPNTMCRECETIVCGANLRVWEVDFKPQDKLQKYCTLDFVK